MTKYFKVVFLLFVINWSFFELSAQKIKYGIDFTPGIAAAFVNATAPYNKYSKQEFNDSIQKQQNGIFSPGFGIHMIQKAGRFDELYIGLQYQLYGWGRTKRNLHFLDSIHSDVGKVLQLSQTVEQDVRFSFMFHQIVVPVYRISTLRFNKMPTGMTLGVYYGGALHATFSKKAIAQTIGFSAYGKKKFDLPSEKFQMLPFTLSVQAGLKMSQLIGDDLYFNFMPGFSIVPIPSKNTVERQFQYKLQAGIGVSKTFK